MKKLVICILPLFLIPFIIVSAKAAELIPGGQVVGISLSEGAVTVESIHETLGENARAAGIQPGDKLLSINGQPVESLAQVRSILEKNPSKLQLLLDRNGTQKQLSVTPAITSEGAKLGLYLKEGVTGIGTVTYYDPATGTYGALGHGVNQPDGKPVQLHRGSTYPAAVMSVQKGVKGKPGQLVGTLAGTQPSGTIQKNTSLGIFGQQQSPGGQTCTTGQAVPGKATILSTVDSTGVQEYSVEILKIYPHAQENGRNLLLKITDPRLLSTTGGIVQGMSGSPILQEGKLVGAVTHVLVNDPTTGYGIFIENMLDAAA